MKSGARRVLRDACGDHSFVGSAHTVETGSLRLNCRGELSEGKEGSVCRFF